jgi:hypothetical protein
MPPTADHCPADPVETAEAYVMGTLHGADAAAFEEHSIACATCATAVGEAEVYVRAMENAVRRLRSSVTAHGGSAT